VMTKPQTSSSSSSADTRAHSQHARLIVLAIVSALIVVGVCVAAVAFSGVKGLVDAPHTSRGIQAASRQRVARSSLRLWCPSAVGLADRESYGDKQFALSEGNLTSVTSLAAVGSVFNPTISNVSGDSVSSLSQGASAGYLGDAKTSHFADVSLVQDSQGSGMTGTTASWASRGDVAGLAGSSCISSALDADFLIPSTAAGNTHQLVVANDSSKATVVSVSVWGTKQSGQLDSRIASQMTVNAHSQSSLNLSAAAPSQSALFVRMTSSVTPVYAVVKSQLSQGLASHGTEFEQPVISSASTQSARQIITGLTPQRSTSLQLFSHTAHTVRFWWLTDHGAASPSTAEVEANRVSVHDCGRAPDHARGLIIDDARVAVMATQTVSGASGQQDFASIAPTPAYASSAIALPHQLHASLFLANPSEQPQSVRLSAVQSDGTSAGEKSVTIPAQSTQTIDPSSIAKNLVAVVCTQSSRSPVRWALTLTSDDLDRAKVAGLSVLTPTSLMPHTVQILTPHTPTASTGRQ
jgi:hypothetical protein